MQAALGGSLSRSQAVAWAGSGKMPGAGMPRLCRATSGSRKHGGPAYGTTRRGLVLRTSLVTERNFETRFSPLTRATTSGG